MCKAEVEMDKSLAIEALQEYSVRKGIYIKKKEAKGIVKSFSKEYERLPRLKELWTITDKVIAQRAEGKSGADITLEQKMSKELQAKKAKDQAKVARKKQLEAQQQIQSEPESVAPQSAPPAESKGSNMVRCSKCGNLNPQESKFCLECGNKLGIDF